MKKYSIHFYNPQVAWLHTLFWNTSWKRKILDQGWMKAIHTQLRLWHLCWMFCHIWLNCVSNRWHRNKLFFNYRSKRSFGQGNIFTSLCHSVHRGGGTWPGTPRDQAGTPPDQAGTPQDQTPPRTRQEPPPGPGRNPPGTKHHPLWTRQEPPGTRHPPGTADSGIRSTFGRYASYWNAFLFGSAVWGCAGMYWVCSVSIQCHPCDLYMVIEITDQTRKHWQKQNKKSDKQMLLFTLEFLRNEICQIHCI